MCMEQDSVDILQSGLIEHYMQQSDELEETSLTRFAAWYAFQSSKRICKTNPNFEDENVESEGTSLVDNPKYFQSKIRVSLYLGVKLRLSSFNDIILYRTKLTFIENSFCFC